MEFYLQHHDVHFEIPDRWLRASDVKNFSASAASFVASTNITWPTSTVPLIEVGAPIRDFGIKWFDEDRMISVLRGMIHGNVLPPLEAHEPPHTNHFKYKVRDGFHRYYASAALGFDYLPISLRPHFDMNDL